MQDYSRLWEKEVKNKTEIFYSSEGVKQKEINITYIWSYMDLYTYINIIFTSYENMHNVMKENIIEIIEHDLELHV